MDPDAIDRVVRKYAGELGLDRGYPAHSMCATFITGRSKTAHSSRACKRPPVTAPSTTKLYGQRGYNLEKAAPFFATYGGQMNIVTEGPEPGGGRQIW
jgi:integrase/recombinase XerD